MPKLTAEQWMAHIREHSAVDRMAYPNMLANLREEVAKLTTEQLANELPLLPDTEHGWLVHQAICLEAAARLRAKNDD